jgi:hypothetical protein
MIDDFISIYQTYSRYAHAIADRRFRDWAEEFTEDGVMVNAFGTYTGRENLYAFVTQQFSSAPRTKILWSNPLIEVNGDTATGQTEFLVVRDSAASSTGLAITHMGRYNDLLRKEGGRWLIAERRAVNTG